MTQDRQAEGCLLTAFCVFVVCLSIYEYVWWLRHPLG